MDVTGEARLDIWGHMWQPAKGHSLGDQSTAIQALWAMASHGTQIISILSLPGPLRSFKWKSFASIIIVAKRRQREVGSGLGSEQVEGGTWPPSPRADLFWPISSSPRDRKAIKSFQASDYCRGAPTKIEKKMLL